MTGPRLFLLPMDTLPGGAITAIVPEPAPHRIIGYIPPKRPRQVTRLERAKRAVLARMVVCNMPGCTTCRPNGAVLEELVLAAAEASRGN